jgi:hypothetical protein
MSRITNAIDSNESYLTALIFCEKVITDKESGTTTLISTFDILEMPAFPAVMPNFLMYVAVARGQSAENEFYLGISAPGGDLVMRGGFIVGEWRDALVSDFVVPLKDLPLATAGLYLVRVFVVGRVLMERYIDVRISPQSPAERGD